MRCVYNRFGVFIELQEPKGPNRLFVSRPKEESFTECTCSTLTTAWILKNSRASAEETPEFALNYLQEHEHTEYKSRKKSLRKAKTDEVKKRNEEAILRAFHELKFIPEIYYGNKNLSE